MRQYTNAHINSRTLTLVQVLESGLIVAVESLFAAASRVVASFAPASVELPLPGRLMAEPLIGTQPG